MDTLQFILIAGAVIALIAWAMDIPTTKWEGFKLTPKKPLWQILKDSVTQETESTDENSTPARTYTEAVTRMQEREEARSERSARHRHSSQVRRR